MDEQKIRDIAKEEIAAQKERQEKGGIVFVKSISLFGDKKED